MDIHRVEDCTSTQDEAKALARDGAPDGTVVFAKKMTGGRGQQGRAWHAPEGGVYMSIVLRDLDQPRLLTLALGNAVAEVLEVAGAEPQLKWVNDVLVGGKKIAGILVESESTGSHIDFLVAGIGVNVNGAASDFPAELREHAVTLEEVLGADNCIEDLETYLLEEIQRWAGLVRGGHTQEVLSAWRARDYLQGRSVAVDGVEGEAAGIADDGALRLRTDSGEATVQSGTVALL